METLPKVTQTVGYVTPEGTISATVTEVYKSTGMVRVKPERWLSTDVVHFSKLKASP